jgi:hypothetical protein
MTPRRLIYVHGIKPKPEPALHAAVLRECLLAGIQRADPATAAAMAADPDWLVLVSWSELFYARFRDLAIDRPGIDSLLSNPAPRPEQIAAVFGWRHRLTTAAHRLGDRFPLLINTLATEPTRLSLAEAFRYFANRDGVSGQVRDRVRAALRDAAAVGARVLLTGHSLGSVVAFDTLWELSRAGDPAARIEHFLTLGSPLGAAWVRRRLLGARERGAARFPAGLGAWTNLAAVGDLATLGQPFPREFAAMTAAGLVGFVADRRDLVNPFRGADGLNVHRCYGYHTNPVTGAVIAGWWRGVRPDAVLSRVAA